MPCIACGRRGGDLCSDCRCRLPMGGERTLASGIRVEAPFAHQGTARALVHRFKYQGSDRAGWILATAMADLVSPGSILVPVPRNPLRLVRYGIDPAADLSRKLRSLTGTPVASMLRSPIWARAQAGLDRAGRAAPRFISLGGRAGGEALVLVDDVVTTGGTVLAAAAALGQECIVALTATIRGD